MNRQQAQGLIDQLYGAPGENHDTDVGQRLILDLLAEKGLAALTDDAIVRLAEMHKRRDELEARWNDETG